MEKYGADNYWKFDSNINTGYFQQNTKGTASESGGDDGK